MEIWFFILTNLLEILDLFVEFYHFLNSCSEWYGNEVRGKPSIWILFKYYWIKFCDIFLMPILKFFCRFDSRYISYGLANCGAKICNISESNDKTFFTIIPKKSNNKKELNITVLNFINKCNIISSNFRNHSSEMHIYQLEHHIPYAAYSITWVGVGAVKNCSGAIFSFRIRTGAEQLFVGSTFHCGIMLKDLKGIGQVSENICDPSLVL